MWSSIRLTPRLASIRLVPTFAFRCSYYRPKTTATDDQAKVCVESLFWNKKLDRAILVTDVDKDGLITRKDFKLLSQRYQQLGSLTAEQQQRIHACLTKLCDLVGLTDDTKQFTYEEFKRRHANVPDISQVLATNFRIAFDALDIDGDGVVSIKDWELHYKCMGIDPKHAKASFEAMDTNGDGVVSLEEFTAYHVEFFSSTDNKLNSAILYGPLD